MRRIGPKTFPRWAFLGFLGLATGLAAEPILRVPEGFSVVRVAGPPHIAYPMFAAPDGEGGLFVAESSGLDLYEELRAQTQRCRVSRLSGRDGRGVFQQAVVFASQLVFPMGLAWREGKLYVADPPDLVALADTDGDGHADQRAVVLSGFGHTDNGSLHGLVFGPDGWLYMTMGQPDGYQLKRPDGSMLSGKSGALLRCRPDGSDAEVVCRGFENLVEIEFLPSGEIVGTDNWFSLPAGGERDALVHLVEGGLYPLQLRDRGSAFLDSGDPLPPIRMYPAVALSGLALYRGGAFPERFQGLLYSAQFNARKVVAHRLERWGSTFRASDEDFLATDDPDFHPSDVLEDGGGGLLVVDTGAWYVHHCPTGGIRKAPAEGGIYLVRFDQGRGGAGAAPETPMPKFEAGPDLHGLATADPDEAARAARAAGRLGKKEAEGPLRELLASPAMHARMAAAEALAHCGSKNTVPALFTALEGEVDRFLEHALIHALYRLADTPALEAALMRPHPRVQKAALVLLDQPPRQTLAAAAAVERLLARDEGLRRAALKILQRHPQWAPDALPAMRGALENPASEPGQSEGLRELILAFQDDPSVRQMAAAGLTNASLGSAQRLVLAEAMALASPSPWPEAWTAALDFTLREAEPPVRLQAARAARRQQIAPLHDTLLGLIGQTNLQPELRLEALRATISRHPQLTPAAFELALERIQPRSDAGARLAAAELLGRASWADPRNDPARLVALVDGDSLIAPSTLLPLLAQSEGGPAAPPVWSYLTRAAEKGWRPGDKDLGLLRSRLGAQSGERLRELARLAAPSGASQHDQIAEALGLLSGGSPERGRLVFAHKAGCAACHRVGPSGGTAGPDLTKIGAVRSGRDLVESVVAPSATFAQGYETFAVALRDGEEITGVRVRQADESFVLRDASGAEIRLLPGQIQSARRSELSLMPEGLLSALTPEEVRDLFAYLQSLR